MPEARKTGKKGQGMNRQPEMTRDDYLKLAACARDRANQLQKESEYFLRLVDQIMQKADDLLEKAK